MARSEELDVGVRVLNRGSGARGTVTVVTYYRANRWGYTVCWDKPDGSPGENAVGNYGADDLRLLDLPDSRDPSDVEAWLNG